MGSWVNDSSSVTTTSGFTSVGTIPTGVAAGDRVYAFVGSGSANPNALTGPAGWVKCAEYAPTGFFKSALYYRDVAAGGEAGATVTWTWAVTGRTWAVLQAYRGVETARAPLWATASGVADSPGPTNVPVLTVPTDDWLLILAAARESPGTDLAKTWALTGAGTDVERVDEYGNNAGTGVKLTVAVYDTNGPDPGVAGGGGGGGGSAVTLTGAPPLNTYNSIALTSPLRIGATLDKAAISYWEPKLHVNGWMRIFPDGSTKMPNDWEDSRYQYCRRVGAHPFISTKIDGDPVKLQQMYDYLMTMPSWIKDDPDMLLWMTDHHEPEKEFTPTGFKNNFIAFWNKINTLPSNIRTKIKCGPAQTSQWTESASKGNFNYSTYDPLVGDFWGVDTYVLSASGGAAITSYPNPVAFLQHIKAYVPPGGRPKIFPEFGAIGAPFDTDGTARAAFLQGCYNELITWPDFGGFIWWNDDGTSSDSPTTGIGTARYFQLNRRHTGTDNSYTEIPSQTTTVTVGSGGGSGTARSVTLSQPAASTHLWSVTVPMVAPPPPAPVNPWSHMGRPQK
ncbi:MAG TPA: hypothetical protein VF657_17705 [Actinoplanes sp.]